MYGIQAQDIARFLAAEVRGGDAVVNRPASLDRAANGCMVFAVRPRRGDVGRLNNLDNVLAIVAADVAPSLRCPHIVVDNPRLAFARALQAFFVTNPRPDVAATARISDGARVGADVSIGDFAKIADNVVIGDGTIIGDHVVIADDTVIGSFCLIRTHAVIGDPGFGFERDENSALVRMPQLGGVRIGDGVELGAHCSVARAALDETIISDRVKADDNVYIAHNVRIGADTIIAAGSVICGSVKIGREVWIGAGASLKESVRVGDKALVGLGAVMINDVPARRKVVGNPAQRFGCRA